MANCCICGRNTENLNKLVVGENAADKEMCGTCADKLRVLNNMKNSSVQEVEGEINYFYNNVNNNVLDLEVKSWLLNFLPEKASKAKEMKSNGSIGYTNYNSTDDGGFKWIEIVLCLVWVAFISIVFLGMWWWYKLGGFIGFLTFLGSILGAFIYIAPMMMMVKMAEQVSEIRNMISRR